MTPADNLNIHPLTIKLRDSLVTVQRATINPLLSNQKYKFHTTAQRLAAAAELLAALSDVEWDRVSIPLLNAISAYIQNILAFIGKLEAFQPGAINAEQDSASTADEFNQQFHTLYVHSTTILANEFLRKNSYGTGEEYARLLDSTQQKSADIYEEHRQTTDQLKTKRETFDRETSELLTKIAEQNAADRADRQQKFDDQFKAAASQATDAVAKATDAEKRAESAVQQATTKLEDIKRLAEDAGITNRAINFANLAKEHDRHANWWFSGTLCAVAVVITFASVSAFGNIAPLPANVGFPALAVKIAARGVLLSMLIYAVTWTTRNYRAHRHNALINKHRATALLTFEAFTGSKDEATRNAVLAQATQAIFSAQPTGYLPSEAEPTPHGPVVDIVQSFRGKD